MARPRLVRIDPRTRGAAPGSRPAPHGRAVAPSIVAPRGDGRRSCRSAAAARRSAHGSPPPLDHRPPSPRPTSPCSSISARSGVPHSCSSASPRRSSVRSGPRSCASPSPASRWRCSPAARLGAAAAAAPLAFLIVGATFSAIPFTLLAFATLSLPASLASLLMATTPLFTAIVSAAWLRQRVTKGVAVGLGVGFGAVVFLLGGAPIELSGRRRSSPSSRASGAALSYAVAGTYVRRRLGDVAPLDLATGQLLAAALILLPVAIATGIPATVPSPPPRARSSRWASSRRRSPGRCTSGSRPGRRRPPPAARRSWSRCSGSCGAG